MHPVCFSLYQFISAYSFSSPAFVEIPICTIKLMKLFDIVMEKEREQLTEGRQNLFIHVKQPLQPVLMDMEVRKIK